MMRKERKSLPPNQPPPRLRRSAEALRAKAEGGSHESGRGKSHDSGTGESHDSGTGESHDSGTGGSDPREFVDSGLWLASCPLLPLVASGFSRKKDLSLFIAGP